MEEIRIKDKEEGYLFISFFKDGDEYSKAVDLRGDKKEVMAHAIMCAKKGVLNWANLNGDLDEIFKKQIENFKA